MHPLTSITLNICSYAESAVDVYIGCLISILVAYPGVLMRPGASC